MASEMRSNLSKSLFLNTSIAYSHLSNPQLSRALCLFHAMSNSFLSRVGPQLVLIALKAKLPIKWLIKRTMFAHFCGGESLQNCEPLIQKLKERGVDSLLDFASEASHKEQASITAFEEILCSMDFAQSKGLGFTVFKPSAIFPGDLLEKASCQQALNSHERGLWERSYERFHSICAKAERLSLKLLIDAEESWIQPAIDDLVWLMILKFNHQQAVIFQTVQLYRKDRFDYVRKIFQDALKAEVFLGFKLVRGAYLEKESLRAEKLGMDCPIFDSKSQTDAAFNQALAFMVENIERIWIFLGTHNEESTQLLVDLLMQKNPSPTLMEHITFSQLLGMSDHITFNLANLKFKVVKYIPYGPIDSAIPYLMRRAQENSSILGQSVRDKTLLKKELERRRLKTQD